MEHGDVKVLRPAINLHWDVGKRMFNKEVTNKFIQ